eukprot:TRINITY_DN9361_c0_g1_i1.p1 TRINITY_DN9361_c0_g1~~TRINITY_DN9361_c0_g1_i1.p1  ORF type:complete len:282 (-),score=58.32 TRINITY_DN9361_c0_g1_i1:46-891(-)
MHSYRPDCIDGQPHPLTPANYKDRFQNFLFYEEHAFRHFLQRFNKVDAELRRDFTLDAPGDCVVVEMDLPRGAMELPDQRPLIPGGVVFVRRAAQHQVWRGSVRQAAKRYALLQVPKQVLGDRELSYAHFTLRFGFNRIPYRYMHRAIESIDAKRKGACALAFPVPAEVPVNPWARSAAEPAWTTAKLDEVQMKAIRCILTDSLAALPFLLLGPFGTGKTSTLEEAIVQRVYAKGPTCRILVCTHSNSCSLSRCFASTRPIGKSGRRINTCWTTASSMRPA